MTKKAKRERLIYVGSKESSFWDLLYLKGLGNIE